MAEVFGALSDSGIVEAYKKKYWQYQNPEIAKAIFLGLDANWDENIGSNKSLYDEILGYLDDGVKYWEDNGYHHPFLLPNYKKGDGYKFHANFVKTNITSQYADYISFVEILSIPTYGRSSKAPCLFYEMIDVNYLRSLNDIIFDNKPKLVFMAKSVYETLKQIKKKKNLHELFNFDMDLPSGINFSNRLMNIHNSNNVFIFVHTHFSGYISNDHLINIGKVTMSFLGKEKSKHWWKINYSCNNQANFTEVSRYLQANDVQEVNEIVNKNIEPFVVKDAFKYLELKIVQDNEVDTNFVWN